MDGKLTKEDIERVFNEYDKDNNGTIENEELTGFLKDLLEVMKKVLTLSHLLLSLSLAVTPLLDTSIQEFPYCTIMNKST